MPSLPADGDNFDAPGSMFIAGDRVEAEIGLDLPTLARDRDGPLILEIGGVEVIERADLVRFKKLLRLRARHKRLFGTELDAVPAFLRRAWCPPDRGTRPAHRRAGSRHRPKRRDDAHGRTRNQSLPEPHQEDAGARVVIAAGARRSKDE